MATNSTPQNWFMYHGGYAHGGNAGSGSNLNSSTVASKAFQRLYQIQVNGSILSVPAVADGYIYVGLANCHDVEGSIGGALQKYDIATGQQACPQFTWPIDVNDRDVHGFTGMGCTPTVINGYVYFVGFNATLYCLNASDLSLAWKTDLRYADMAQNQPVTNTEGVDVNNGVPAAEGWSSPMVVNMTIGGVSSPRVFVGIGEGENPNLYSFIYCLDGNTGKVVWIYCTNQYTLGQANPVNQLPSAVLKNGCPTPFTEFTGQEVTRGCSVWSAIAYDADTGFIYATTGQPASPYNAKIDQGLPSAGWSSGILALNAATGEFVAFTQMPASTAYRPTDLDVDIGSAVTIYTLPASGSKPARKVVAVGCKNGGFMVCDATTLEVINAVSLLPMMMTSPGHYVQIPQIDPHPPESQQNIIFPQVSNDTSNVTWGENYFGPFNTAAVDPLTGNLFIGIGGPNYHNQAPGIDSATTPFMKAVKWDTLTDAWPTDGGNPPLYTKVNPPNGNTSMYTNPGESGLSSPAVVNDVVFATTSWVSIYAFKTSDGTLLWSDQIGHQTGGFNGGYGYCLGAAIYGNYVVAGALVQGLEGGLLNVYGLKS